MSNGPEALPLVLLSVAMPSRHPANQRAYDAIESVTFVVEGIDTPFRSTVSGSPQPAHEGFNEGIWRARVAVRRPGAYRVSLRAETPGQIFERERRFSFRDILMVSIGDSFASGQGNPDIDGVPSSADVPFCKTTTLKTIKTHAAGEEHE